MSNFTQVLEFHQQFELPIGATPKQLVRGHSDYKLGQMIHTLKLCENAIRLGRWETDEIAGRYQMMIEELREFMEAVLKGDLEAQADSLVDLVYFALGTAAMMGLPFDRLFVEVHRANMAKVRVESTEESKRLNKLDVKKPEGWQPPDIAGVLARWNAYDAITDEVTDADPA
jgi:predicted HAD superfamily Cof-like phosphohydrolase